MEDIKLKVKEIVLGHGIAEEQAEAIAQKCYDTVSWRPYGGATTYAAIDAHKAAMEYAHEVEEESMMLRGIVDNIVSSEEMTSVDEKAAAITQAANEFRDRVNSMSMEEEDDKSIWGKVKSLWGGEKRQYSTEQRREMAKKGHARPDGSYPIADEADLKNAIRAWGRGGATAADKAHIMKRARALGKTDVLPENWKSVNEDDDEDEEDDEKTIKHEGGKWVVYSSDGKRKFGSYTSKAAAHRRLAQIEIFKKKEVSNSNGFKVYLDSDGQFRWLATSSNAFEDLEKELFTTKALEEAIEYADKSGERGPLLVYHVPSAEIGQCDFQGLVGRFLVESGTFDDTPLGNKALDYYINSDEEHQVSIGYTYKEGDELDGQYDWLRINERSVCPPGRAANPWTSFKVIGESPVNADKVAELERIFGKEMASSVISSAESKTKDLEASVKFKEKTTPEITAEDIKSMQEALKSLEDEGLRGKFEAVLSTVGAKEEEETSVETPEATTEETSTSTPDPTIQGIATLIVDLTNKVEALSSIEETVKTLQTEMKELKKTEDEKVSEIIRPRWSFNPGDRPSTSDDNLVDGKNVKELIDNDPPASPAAAYVEDLLKGRVVRA